MQAAPHHDTGRRQPVDEGDPPRVRPLTRRGPDRAAIEAGADGYLSRTVTPEELVETIERVDRGERVLIAERAHLGVTTFRTCIRSAYRNIDVATRPQAVVYGLSQGFEARTDHRAVDEPGAGLTTPPVPPRTS